MDDVRVHRNSSEPAKLGALAFTKGAEIHLGPEQEEHLPHEAWHVVQQKQGRVQATTQMKGANINTDPVLEQEADRMAPRLEAGSDCVAQRRSETRPAAASEKVAQLKLRAGARVPAPSEISQSLALTYLDSLPRLFLLPDKWTKAVPEVDTRVLEGDRIYLLGEIHLQSTFVRDVQPWPSVSKIVEDLVEIPGREGVYLPTGPKLFSLESAHLGMLNTAVLARDQVKQLWADGIKNVGLTGDPNFKVITRILEVQTLNNEQYKKYAADTVVPKDASVLKFAKALNDKYVPGLLKLQSALGDLRTANDQSLTDSARVRDAKIRPKLNVVRTLADNFLPLIADLQAIVGIPRGSPEARQISTAINPRTPFDPNASGILMNRRDEGMAKRALSVGAPALVKLGDEHVDGVARRIGKTALPVHQPTKLGDVTMLGRWLAEMLGSAASRFIDATTKGIADALP